MHHLHSINKSKWRKLINLIEKKKCLTAEIENVAHKLCRDVHVVGLHCCYLKGINELLRNKQFVSISENTSFISIHAENKKRIIWLRKSYIPFLRTFLCACIPNIGINSSHVRFLGSGNLIYRGETNTPCG